ncbi:MAG: hypothetical protein NTW86_09710, partial [Candidatus Sumerlaeota bacterium]|nr:hypothetical protein [Candidatus Sumerlaeota bacterium]
MKRQAKVLIILAAFAFGVIAASHAAPKAEGKPKKEAAVKSPKQETKAESAKAAATAPATPEMSIEEAWKQAPTYKFGGSRAALTAIENQVRESYGSPDARAAVGKKLVDLLGSNATGEAKEFACRQLAIVGGDDAVPALSALLLGPDEKLAEYGRYALDRIPGKAADEALLAALDKTQKGTKVGVINSLGVRKVAAAVPKIAPLAGDSDSAIASAKQQIV